MGFRMVRPLLPSSAQRSLHTVAEIPLAGGTSRFDYQSLDTKTHRLFIAHLGASQVSVFDTQSNTVLATLTGLAQVHGVLFVPEERKVYASATGDNQVVVIDAKTLAITARVPGGIYPDGITYDPVDHRLFVSDETGQTETVIDTHTNERIATIPLGGEAGNSQYDPVSHQVLVDVQTLNQLIAINPATLQVVARTHLPDCQSDHSLLIDAPQRLAFVACDGNAQMLVLDLPTQKVLAQFSVGSSSDVLALDSGWHLLYVASESGVVSIFEEPHRQVQKVDEEEVAPSAHTIAVDEQTHRVYLPLEQVHGKPVLRIALFQ
jgi:YVTN family beta-propeller protein